MNKYQKYIVALIFFRKGKKTKLWRWDRDDTITFIFIR